MSRTLTAGVSTPTAPRTDDRNPAAPQWDAESSLWSLLCDLWGLATERRRLRDRLDRLNAQLDDPALAGHPKHAAAAMRGVLWRMAVVALDEQAQHKLPMVARMWDRLPQRRKAELRQHPEWGGALHGKAAAAAAWEYAKREAGVPVVGCPF